MKNFFPALPPQPPIQDRVRVRPHSGALRRRHFSLFFCVTFDIKNYCSVIDRATAPDFVWIHEGGLGGAGLFLINRKVRGVFPAQNSR